MRANKAADSHLRDRRHFLGGSDARIIMGNDETLLLRLWREKRGELSPEDLSDNLIVQLGTITEDLNRRWYERNTGHAVKYVQRRIQHPVNKWMMATLDGLVDPGGAVFEAKFMLPWTFSEEAAVAGDPGRRRTDRGEAGQPQTVEWMGPQAAAPKTRSPNRAIGRAPRSAHRGD